MRLPDCCYRISVKAVIKDKDGKILLIKEKNNNWELPGGGLEHGEEPHKGLAREIKEELGCEVTWISDKPVGFWTLQTESYVETYAFVGYEAKIEGEINFSDEAEEIGWFSPEELKNIIIRNNTAPYFSVS